MKRRVGAPKGGRVHWLILHLPAEFKRAYIISYNYALHNYIFYRKDKSRLYDIFIVLQSSKHYWQVMYACPKEQRYEHFGYRNTRMIAEFMFEIYMESDRV